MRRIYSYHFILRCTAISIFLFCCLHIYSMQNIHAYTITTSESEQNSEDYSSKKIIIKIKNFNLFNQLQKAIETEKLNIKILKKLVRLKMIILENVDALKSRDAIIRILKKLSIVEYVEKDHLVSISSVYPNDPSGIQLWGLHNIGQSGGTYDADIDAPEAWSINRGDPEVVIGVVDTGVDYDHADLAENIWQNPGEIPGNGIDDDGNGYIDDVHGIDAYNKDSDPYDDHGHGTHVAGIIGAVGNNDIGVVGVNWHIKIMALKFFNSTGIGSVSDAIECLEYMIMMKSSYGINVRIANNSWGSHIDSSALRDAIVHCREHGILFVAAAGNDYGNDNDLNPVYPASYSISNVLSVAATDRQDLLTHLSNYGLKTVALAAPGEEILSTFPINNYKMMSGTSLAAAYVSGAAALIWAQYPSYAFLEVKNLILNTVDPVSALSNRMLTGGRLNINNALSCVPGTATGRIILPQNGFTAYPGEHRVVSLSLADCSSVIEGASVLVTPTNGDVPFNLWDDGISPDAFAGDGFYTGMWEVVHEGSTNLNFEASFGGEIITRSVSGKVIEIPVYRYNGQVDYEWIDASSGINLGLRDDDDILVPIGFNFTFYGIIYNRVRISSNGYITFGPDGSNQSNAPIPSSTYPNEFIAPFWDDLNPDAGGAVYYLMTGTSPNRRLVIEWYEVPHYPNSGTATFEIVLFETSNTIVFQYLDVNLSSPAYDYGASATVGIEDPTGSGGLQYSYNQAVLEDQSAIRFSCSEIEMSLDMNNSTFMVGDTLRATVTIENLTENTLEGDIWIAVRLPSGSFLFYDGPNTFSTTADPSYACAVIGPGPYITEQHIVTYTFPVGSQGVYTWYAVFVPCGSDVYNTSNWKTSYINSFIVQ